MMAPDRQWVLNQFSLSTTKRITDDMRETYRELWTSPTTSEFAASVMLLRHTMALIESGHLAKVPTAIRSYIRVK